MKLTDEEIRDVSVEVYKKRLGDDDTRRMLEKDSDGGAKLKNRAASYDGLTRAYLDAFYEFGFEELHLRAREQEIEREEKAKQKQP